MATLRRVLQYCPACHGDADACYRCAGRGFVPYHDPVGPWVEMLLTSRSGHLRLALTAHAAADPTTW